MVKAFTVAKRHYFASQRANVVVFNQRGNVVVRSWRRGDNELIHVKFVVELRIIVPHEEIRLRTLNT